VSVDRARDTVVHLGVELGEDVPWTTKHVYPRQNNKSHKRFTEATDLDERFTIMDARFLDVPDGRLLHDVPHLKPLDRLVLWRTSKRKVETTNETNQKISSHGWRKRKGKATLEASSHLGAALGAVRAADVLDVTAAMLVAAAVAALEGLRRENREWSGLDSRCTCKGRGRSRLRRGTHHGGGARGRVLNPH